MLEHQEGSSDIGAAAKAILFLQQHQEHGEDEETEPNAKGWMLPNGPLPCFAPLVAKKTDSEERKTKTKTTKLIIISSAAKSSSTTETGLKGDNDDDFDEATMSTTTKTGNSVSLPKTSMSVHKKSRSPKKCGKKRYRSPKHQHLSTVRQAGPPKKSKTLSIGGSTNHRNKHEPHPQLSYHASNFVDLSLTDDERTVETSNLSSNMDMKVGMRNNPRSEMKFIDAMGQNLTGQAQETFQAIVASAREGYARMLHAENSPVLYEKLPHAIWTNVRLLMEPKEYLRASAAVREEWNNNGIKKTTTTRSNPNSVPQAIELLMKQQQSSNVPSTEQSANSVNNKSQLENSQPSTTTIIKTSQLNCTTKTQGGAIRMDEAASNKLTKSSLRRNLPRSCANRPLQKTNPSYQSALDQKTSQDNLPPHAANSNVQPPPSSIDLTTKSCSATTTTTSSNNKITHGKKSAMQLALRYGFALRLRQYKQEQFSQRNHYHHPSRPVDLQANVEDLMEMAERKLIYMTPVERDDLWNDIEELMEQVGNAV